MSHIDAEYNRLPSWDVRLVGLKDQVVTRGHTDGFLDISTIILNLVEADSGKVDIRPNADTANRHQFPFFNGITKREAMRRVLENLESRCPVSAIGGRR